MPEIRLRPLLEVDFPRFREAEQASWAEQDSFEFFGFGGINGLERRFAESGGISDDLGNLVVDVEGAGAVGSVSWVSVRHGPSTSARALNVGIALFAAHRGLGYGTEAQRQLAHYLFTHTLIERLEASTDIENLAEQRSLEKAGFSREGVLRHAQWRAGAWHDLVLYSRIRGDAA